MLLSLRWANESPSEPPSYNCAETDLLNKPALPCLQGIGAGFDRDLECHDQACHQLNNKNDDEYTYFDYHLNLF